MTRTLVTNVAALFITLSIGSASTASAQSQDDNAGRAKALSAVRDQKSEQLTPPERSMTERALHWYDNHDSRLSWRGLHINMGNFSGGAGFAGGIGLTQRAPTNSRTNAHTCRTQAILQSVLCLGFNISGLNDASVIVDTETVRIDLA